MAHYAFGRFVVDSAARLLLRENRPVEISAKTFDTLVALLQNCGRVLGKDELLTAIWPDAVVEEASLTQSISTLRKILGDSPKEHRYIATVPGRGYAFVAPIVKSTDSQATEPRASEPVPSTVVSESPPSRKSSVRYLWFLVLASGLFVVAASYFRFARSRPSDDGYSSAPLTRYGGLEVCPTFSPGGDRIAFAWDGPKRDNFDIYVKQPGVSQPLRLTDSEQPDISPAWSPDGSVIAFLHMLGNEKAEVSLIHSLSPGPRRVLTMVAIDTLIAELYSLRFLAWSTDGKWLVVPDAPNPGAVSSLFLISAEGGEKRRLTFPPMDNDDFEPAFSPDMSSLAFIRYSSVGASASDLFILKLSKDLWPQGEPRRLTTLNRRVSSPVWMPDGKRILFAWTEPGGNNGLWRMDINDPTQMKPLPIPADSTSALALSHSGNSIVYTRESANTNIWGVTLRSDPNNRFEGIRPWITSSSTEENPQFSPDGRQIAYQSTRSGAAEIWISDRDGSNPRQLTNLGAVISGFPRWSPDGRKIVFHSRLKTSADLYVVDIEGGSPRRIGDGTEAESPSWSSDGKWIYFTSRRTGEPHIWRLPATGGSPTQMTKLKTFCPLESKDGRYLYFVTIPELELWRHSLDDGAERKLLPSLAACSSFAPATKGIYFIRNRPHSNQQELAFLDFANSQTKALTAIPGRAALGVAVSHDERLVLYGQIDRTDSDLILIDRFHLREP